MLIVPLGSKKMQRGAGRQLARRRPAAGPHARLRRRPCQCLSTQTQPGKTEARFTARVIRSINEIPAAEWDALARASSSEVNPFLSHAFLSALEKSGSACREEGWLPSHLLLRWAPEDGQGVPADTQEADGVLVGAVPLYLKSHSYGEYVFDSSWANLSTMVGEPWYPKLQSCVPFTPVTGPRLLSNAPEGMHRLDVVRALGTALIKLAESMQVSGVHVTFNTEEEAAALEEVGFSTRLGLQFHWDNDRNSNQESGKPRTGTNNNQTSNKTSNKTNNNTNEKPNDQLGSSSHSQHQTESAQQADQGSGSGSQGVSVTGSVAHNGTGNGSDDGQMAVGQAGKQQAGQELGDGSGAAVSSAGAGGSSSGGGSGDAARQGYESFEAFLAALKQSKRKSIRQERKSIIKQGLRVRCLTGDELRAAGRSIWDQFYEFYCYTVDRKWGTAYLKKSFFYDLGETMADQVLLVVAEEQVAEGGWKLVAGSLNLVGSETVYGRNWALAPDREFKNLHFELCYYQAVEYAINKGLARVEAGAQGEHKLQRGYLPNLTFSSHWVRHPAMKHAVNRFLIKEQAQVMLGLQNLTLEASPYKQDHTLTALMAKVQAIKTSAVGSVSSVMDSISSADDQDAAVR